MEALEAAITSPWAYLAIFAIAALDAFFPIVPSETLVITAGVFAAQGEPAVVPVILAAAVGAFVGDHISYQIGRSGGGALLRRLRPGTRRHAAFDWARRALALRGGLLLVVARYLPGGRTTLTLTMGAVGYSRRKFAFFDAPAAGSWAIYSTMIGYFGGAAFEHDRLKGLIFGLGVAGAITALVEIVRFIRRRMANRRRTTHNRRSPPGVEPSVPSSASSTVNRQRCGQDIPASAAVPASAPALVTPAAEPPSAPPLITGHSLAEGHGHQRGATVVPPRSPASFTSPSEDHRAGERADEGDID